MPILNIAQLRIHHFIEEWKALRIEADKSEQFTVSEKFNPEYFEKIRKYIVVVHARKLKRSLKKMLKIPNKYDYLHLV
jgi:hypothetical protein